MNLKPRHIKALKWFAARTEPATLFGAGDPALATVRNLTIMGYLENPPSSGGQFRPYQISQKGRELLQAEVVSPEPTQADEQLGTGGT